MRVKAFGSGGKGVVVVLDKKEATGLQKIITTFERSLQGVKALKKKLQKSTPGETPRPANFFGDDPPIERHPCG
jgi:hypothetical protein